MPNQEIPKLYRHTEAFGLKPRARVLKSLVEKGRIPVLDDVMEGSKRVIHCWVPSTDTKIGDTTFVFAGSRYFKSPTGELRSKPDFFVLTPSQAARLEQGITVFETKVAPKK